MRARSGGWIDWAPAALRRAMLQTLDGASPSKDSAPMFSRFRTRYLDLLGSIYIYNEHRGYTSIDRVLEAVRARTPGDSAFIAAVEKHRADERKHYVMF